MKILNWILYIITITLVVIGIELVSTYSMGMDIEAGVTGIGIAKAIGSWIAFWAAISFHHDVRGKVFCKGDTK